MLPSIVCAYDIVTHGNAFESFSFINLSKLEVTIFKTSIADTVLLHDSTAGTATNAKKKVKKVVIAMSLVMLEVKPLDDTTNLDDLAKKLFSEIK